MFRLPRQLVGCRAVVTGASSGIGSALSLELASHGVRLVVTARRAERLSDLTEQIAAAGGESSYVAGDVRDADLRRELVTAAEERLGGLDLLINNAGVGGIGSFATAEPDRLRQIMEVNFMAAAELIRGSLTLLRKSSAAAIVNVSSVLGHVAVPWKSEYCASKFAMHGFSDALRSELAADRIDVILVSPSTTATEFFDQASGPGATVKLRHAASPQLVARATIRAIQRRKREVILSPGGVLLVWADRLLPDLTSRLIRRFA